MIDKRLFEFPISYTTLIGKIALGWGSHETVADECKAAGIKKALITTTGLKGTGIVEEIKAILAHGGIATVVYDKVSSNPKDTQVMEAYQIFKENGCDGVVSVGGGSSHDCGKGVRAVAANGGRYVCEMACFIDPPWMENMKIYKPVTLPQISVNTTAGTGAESTMATVIVNTRVNCKHLVMLPGQAPTTAIIDPLLVRMMPQNLAAQTGFDALAHAFESYLSSMPSKHSHALVLSTMTLVSENLRDFAFNRMNAQACENMCWAESMAGVGISYGGAVGIVHGIGHGISTLYGTHHGLANAALTLPFERYNEPACPEKFGEMAKAMGVDTRGMTSTQAADKWFDEIERLLKDINIETGNLKKQFGVKEADLDHLVTKQYHNDFCMEGNPRKYNYDEIMKLLKEML
jgi:formaldehyde dismutase / methanol dehydrogenase